MYSPEEAAAILQVPLETIKRWCRKGRIKAHYDRGIKQYGYIMRRDDFHAFLREIGEEDRIPSAAGERVQKVS